jgi:hypothetical protein
LGHSDTPDLREPLHLNKEAVLEKLRENLEEERAKRAEATEKEKQARLSVNQVVLDEADQIVGYLWRQFGANSWSQLEELLTKFFENNDYRPKAIKPSHREDSLEKFVRVLSMASNKDLTVEPTDSLYELL